MASGTTSVMLTKSLESASGAVRLLRALPEKTGKRDKKYYCRTRCKQYLHRLVCFKELFYLSQTNYSFH